MSCTWTSNATRAGSDEARTVRTRGNASMSARGFVSVCIDPFGIAAWRTRPARSTTRSSRGVLRSRAHPIRPIDKETPMATILGTGEHRYRVVEDWAKLPDGWEFKDVASVAVDSKDRVYVFNRGEHPMCVFDRDGNFLRSWGEGTFPRAHGLHIDANDILYCTDDGGHFVRKLHDGGQGAARDRRARQARAVHERRAVPPLHAHRPVTQGRDLRERRVRQRARAQVLAGRKAAAVLGRAGHRPRPVQHRAQHRRRPGRLGLRRRSREPPRPGVRRQRPLRDAVDQHAPAVRPVLLPRSRSGSSSSASSDRGWR